MENNVIRLDGVIREWYGLQALDQLVHPHVVPFCERHERLVEDINNAIANVTDYLYKVLWDYIPMALCGEMSHSGTSSKKYPRGTKNFSTEKLTVIQRTVAGYSREAIFELADKAFGFDMGWRSGYGGYRWWRIADTTFRYRRTLPKIAWVDYIIDLQHNTGTVLSKRNSLFSIGSSYEFSKYLDLKREATPIEAILASPNEPKFIKLTQRALTVIGKGVDEYLMSHAESLDMSETVAEFGYTQAALMLKAWKVGELLAPASYYRMGIINNEYLPVDLWEYIKKYEPVRYGTDRFDLQVETDFTDKEWNKVIRYRPVRMYGRNFDLDAFDVNTQEDPMSELMRDRRALQKYEEMEYKKSKLKTIHNNRMDTLDERLPF